MKLTQPQNQNVLQSSLEVERSNTRDKARKLIGAVVTAAVIAAPLPIVMREGGDTDTPIGHEITTEQVVDVETVEHISPEIPPSEQVITLSTQGSLDYREDYIATETDRLDASSYMDKFINENHDIFSRVGSAEAVRVIGLTSAEDSDSPEAGLQEASENNRFLGDQRGQLAADSLATQLNSRFGVDVSSVLDVTSHEDTLSETEIAEVRDIADGDIDSLVRAYNDGLPSIGQQQREVLDRLLKERRGFVVELDFIETIPGKPASIRTEQVEVIRDVVIVKEVSSSGSSRIKRISRLDQKAYIPSEEDMLVSETGELDGSSDKNPGAKNLGPEVVRDAQTRPIFIRPEYGGSDVGPPVIDEPPPRNDRIHYDKYQHQVGRTRYTGFHKGPNVLGGVPKGNIPGRR